MSKKIEPNGKSCAMVGNKALTEMAKKAGKKGNKARMELIQRGITVGIE